jgi:hypothetical protein
VETSAWEEEEIRDTERNKREEGNVRYGGRCGGGGGQRGVLEVYVIASSVLTPVPGCRTNRRTGAFPLTHSFALLADAALHTYAAWSPFVERAVLRKLNIVLNVAIFWDTSPCSPYVNRHFGGMYYFHLQGRKSAEQRNQRDTFFWIVGSHTHYMESFPRRWKHAFLPL